MLHHEMFLIHLKMFIMSSYVKRLSRNLAVLPQEDCKKNWYTAAAIGVAALINGLFGSSASGDSYAAAVATNESNRRIAEATNQANMDMTKLTNETNYRIASDYNANQVQLQNDMNDFNMQMWRENNAYNDPSAVLKRAQGAGINPNNAFGTNTSASPVQQTSIPDQALPQYESSKNNPWSETIPYKDLSYLKDMINQLSEIPSIKERIDAQRLENKRRSIENRLMEFDLREKEDEAKLFSNFGFVRDNNGILVPYPEYENLSDADKQSRFLKPTGYLNSISDKKIDLETYNNLPQEQKSIYTPTYDNALPSIEKLPIRTRDGFETWKSLQATSNVLANVRADRLQNELRAAVASGQLQDTDTIKAMIDLPSKTWTKLVKDIDKVSAEIDRETKINKNLETRLSNQDKLLSYTVSKLENEGSSDIIGIIKKHVPEGGLQDFLITAVALIREASGNSGITKYASFFQK